MDLSSILARLDRAEREIERLRNLEVPPAFAVHARVRHSSNQSISYATNTTLAFDTEVSDAYAMHDTVTNNSRITVPSTGVYLLTACTYWENTISNGSRDIWFLLNGSVTIEQQYLYTSGDIFTQCVAVYPLSASDYVQVQVYQTNGSSGSVVVHGNANYSPIFTVTLL